MFHAFHRGDAQLLANERERESVATREHAIKAMLADSFVTTNAQVISSVSSRLGLLSFYSDVPTSENDVSSPDDNDDDSDNDGDDAGSKLDTRIVIEIS